MHEVTTTAMVVEPVAFAGRAHPISTVVPRHEIEEALRSSEDEFELWLDVAERDSEPVRMNISVTPADLEQLLQASTADEIRITFDGDQLAAAFDPDFEAHGIRETAVVLTAAVAAATATVAAADAMPVMPADDGGAAVVSTVGGAVGAAGIESPAQATGGAGLAGESGPGGAVAASGGESPAQATGGAVLATESAPGGAVAASGGESPAVAMGGAGAVTASSTSGGLTASAQSPAELTGGAGIVVAPSPPGAVAAAGGQSPAEMTGGAALPTPLLADDGSGFSIPDPGPEAIVIGGLALLITGAGVVAARSRRRPALP
jgi:hypothetical protein